MSFVKIRYKIVDYKTHQSVAFLNRNICIIQQYILNMLPSKLLSYNECKQGPIRSIRFNCMYSYLYYQFIKILKILFGNVDWQIILSFILGKPLINCLFLTNFFEYISS